MKSARGYEWAAVVLRLTGRYLDPREVTKALGIEPDDCAKKGDMYGPKHNRVCKQGVWSLFGGPSKSRMETQIANILRQIRPMKNRIRKLIRENRHVEEAHLDIGYSPPKDCYGPSFVLKSEMMNELTSLGIDIEISVYVRPD
jgi:hypothetical protein